MTAPTVAAPRVCSGCGDAEPGHHVQSALVRVERVVAVTDHGSPLATSTQQVPLCDACLADLAAGIAARKQRP